MRSCLQDESGRTNRACDWPARTCNASGSRADCAVSRRLPGQSRASLPAREESRSECDGRVFRLRDRSPSRLPTCLPACLPPCPLSPFPPLPRRRFSLLPSFVVFYALSPLPHQRLSVNPAADPLSTLFFFHTPGIVDGSLSSPDHPSLDLRDASPLFRYRPRPMMIGVADWVLPPFSSRDRDPPNRAVAKSVRHWRREHRFGLMCEGHTGRLAAE